MVAGIVIAVIVIVAGVLVWSRSNSDVASGAAENAKLKASKADK